MKKMTAKAALEKAKRRWGPTAAVQHERRCKATVASKAAASAALKAHREKRPPDGRAVGWNLLNAEEQQRRHERTEWRKREQALLNDALASLPYSVGTISELPGFGAAFHVRGSGESWEDAFTEADRRAAR